MCFKVKIIDLYYRYRLINYLFGYFPINCMSCNQNTKKGYLLSLNVRYLVIYIYQNIVLRI